MKLLGIHLTRFGHFTDHEVELPAGAGMHVLFGPNEAGKSTLLDAVTYSLFGWPSERSRPTYAFEHRTSALLAGLTLESDAGERVDIRRRKGNKGTLIDPATNAASPQLETQLARLLRGLTSDQWRNRHALTQERLRAGGQAMLDSGGDAAQAFAAAEDGVGVVHEVLAAIRARREALLTTAGRKGAIYDAIKQYEEAARVVKGVGADVERYERDVKRRDEIAAQLDGLRSEQVRLVAEADRLEHVRGAAGQLARWTQLGEELAAVPELAAPWSREHHDEHAAVSAELTQVDASIAEVQVQLEQAEAKLAELTIDDALLAAAEEVASLQERLGQVRDARASLPALDAAVIAAERALRDAVSEAGLEGDLEAIGARIPTRAARAALREAADRREELEAQLRAADTAVDEARAAHERAVATSEAVGTAHAADEQALGVLLDDAATLNADVHRAAGVSLDSRRDELERRAASLPGSSFDLAALRSASMPAPEDIATVRATLDRLDAAIADQEQARLNARTHLERQRAELDTLERGDSVADPETLASKRAARDATWAIIRGAVLGGDTTSADVQGAVPTFDDAQRDTDAYADAIAGAGERAGVASRLRREIADDEQRERTANAELERLRAERDATIGGQWSALWAPAGIEATSPDAMASFVQQVEDIRAAAAALDADRSAHDAERLRIAGLVRELRAALGLTAALDQPADIDAFVAVRSQAADVRRQLDAAREQRAAARADVDSASRTLAAAERSLEETRSAASTHERTWSAAAADLALTTGSVPAARALCDALDAAELAVGELHAAAARRRDAGTLVEAFTHDVAAVVATLPDASSYGTESPELVITQLGAAVREQSASAVRRTAANERIDELRSQLAAASGRRAAATERRAAQRDGAGVADDAALAQLDAAWQQRAALEAARRDIDAELLAATRLTAEQLLELRAGDDDPALAARVDQLRSRASGSAAEVDALTKERDTIVAAVDAALRTSDVADARQRQAMALAQVEQLVPELRSLAIQEQVLADFLDLHARESRGPLLERASGFFARLTCERYAGIVLDITDDGSSVLRAAREGADPVPVDGLSEGARDQFFLALRLAALVGDLDGGGETMPLVVDDILLAFDDERSRATLELLVELSQQFQVLLLTHHDHLVELARATASGDELAVVDLVSAPHSR